MKELFLVLARSAILYLGIMAAVMSKPLQSDPSSVQQRVDALLARMTLAEKIGQMNQQHSDAATAVSSLGDAIRRGEVGSVLNVVDVDTINELQRIATEESRLGIPLLVARDVIHGFKTIMPIPLGQAATWNPGLVQEAARMAAREAAASGLNWTFAPMIDITRDPRWGRIAESPGEDPYLAETMAAAMVLGFQGEELSAPGSIAACAKHFAGYGAAESGRDYATTNLSEYELRNYYLRPFRAAIDAGASTIMASFSDLNGVPATANEFLMRQVLREEWRFEGFVVSDWASIRQLSIHGLTENDRESGKAAVSAGIDMDMMSHIFSRYLAGLIEDGEIDPALIDAAAAKILALKFRLGLFDNAQTDPSAYPGFAAPDALAVAREAALQSAVLLKNDDRALPLDAGKLDRLAVIGPLADAPYEQLGTWIFDGDPRLSVTPLAALRARLGDTVDIRYVRAMKTSRSRVSPAFDDAVEAAKESDVALLFLGEESILSGEAHSRANIDLPGDQAELVRRIRATGKPVIAVILAGRPLTLSNVVDEVDAILFAWHPGTMGGEAITDLLLGVASPSGRLPATFPRMVGQVPIYYNQKNTGKPPSDDKIVSIDEIDTHAPQTSFGMTAFHLDTHYTPLFPFGHGLSYTTFEYHDIVTDRDEIRLGDTLKVRATLVNTGDTPADEVAQLYVRDLAGSLTRPVRELKRYRRFRLEPGEETVVEFELHTDDLAFFGRDMQAVTEPGGFHAWIGGSSDTTLRTGFRIVE